MNAVTQARLATLATLAMLATLATLATLALAYIKYDILYKPRRGRSFMINLFDRYKIDMIIYIWLCAI